MINNKYSIHQKVSLLPLHKELVGTVLSILVDLEGIRYEVRYFWENKPNTVYFFEWELEDVPSKAVLDSNQSKGM